MSLGAVKHHSVGVRKVGDTLSTCERLPIQSMFFRQGAHILSDLVSGIMTLFLSFLSFWILWTEYFLWFYFISFIALLAVPLWVLLFFSSCFTIYNMYLLTYHGSLHRTASHFICILRVLQAYTSISPSSLCAPTVIHILFFNWLEITIYCYYFLLKQPITFLKRLKGEKIFYISHILTSIFSF